MIIENLLTLKINKLTQEQYDRELKAGRLDPNAIYLTPDDSTANNDDIINSYVWGKHDNSNKFKEINVSNMPISKASNGFYSITHNNIASIINGKIVLGESEIDISPVATVSITSATHDSFLSILDRYIQYDNNGAYVFYYIPSNAIFTISNNTVFVDNAIEISMPDPFEYVLSDDENTYSDANDGYSYTYIGKLGELISSLSGATSDIQMQLDNKSPISHAHKTSDITDLLTIPEVSSDTHGAYLTNDGTKIFWKSFGIAEEASF